MPTKIQWRRGTAAAWTTANPTLAQGEPGLETDTAKVKIGDGTTAWATLPYFAPATGGGGTGGIYVDAWQVGIAETMRRFSAGSTAITISNGSMKIVGGATLPSGKTAAHITVISGLTAGAGITHAWMALYRKDTGGILSVTNDLPTTVAGGAWPTGTAVTFDLASPQNPTSDMPVWVGLTVVASSVPTLVGANLSGQMSGLSPVLAANVGVGLTDPPSRPPAVATPAPGVGSNPFYAAIT